MKKIHANLGQVVLNTLELKEKIADTCSQFLTEKKQFLKVLENIVSLDIRYQLKTSKYACQAKFKLTEIGIHESLNSNANTRLSPILKN